MCKENNNGTQTDMIYWRKECIAVGRICVEKGFAALDAKNCFDSTLNATLPLNSVIQRTLASEEYYK